ncbi:transcription factor Adf-1-like [Coregonus clupeaformis]|uniref:transcription factor Adf-1-like n=1 Tax=Coregonus clupeaformis TaxID=59861 RepID=UPI001BE036AD|nr:transcription factor Adf-1-like [Coregonus clupeaformis]
MAAERIISAVSDYPELYNSTLTSYRDPIKKADAWKAVGKQLGLKEEDARKKWRNLRDVFTRKVKADRIRGATGKALKKWRYSELMAFLIPYIQRGRGTGSNNSTEEFDDGKDETTSTSDVLIDLDGSVVDTKMSPPLDNNLHEMTWKDSWQTAGQGDNEDEMFFMSLLPHLKRLPYRKKCAIKLKFHQLLHDAEFEDTD